MATALSVAGIPMPTDKKYDSVNLLPFLKGENSGAPHDRLYWRSAERLAVREGEWKLVRNASAPDELFNLGRDLGEKNNLAAAEPAVAKRLAAALEAWNKELIAPVFSGATKKKAERAEKR
jgi:arylsulfatase A-like enzyme